MKFQLVTLVTLIAAVAASPVKQNNHDDVDVMIVPLETQLYDIDDGEAGGFPGGFFSFNPFGNPFSGFMQSMDDMLRNLREQMTQVLQRLPPDNSEWKDIADGKGNTTSTTKVINGHKVTINETTYANEGENSGAFFKIRVVDVHPTSEEDTDNSEEKGTLKPRIPEVGNKDVEETTPKESSELLEKGSPEIQESANEIPRGKPEDSLSNEIEVLGEDFKTDILPDESIRNYKITGPEYTFSSAEELAEPIREIETNDVNSNYGIDLSNDIYVNQMLADANVEPNPDAELIDVDLINAQSQPQKLQIKDKIIPEAYITTYPDHLWPVLYNRNRS